MPTKYSAQDKGIHFLTKCLTKLIVGWTRQVIDATYLLRYLRLVIIIFVLHVMALLLLEERDALWLAY